jgi:molybdopterin/thiamine biosynthesis adenylyltransferase
MNTLVRQGFLGPDSDQILGSTRIGIVGLGGGGSQVAQQLAHVGIGHFVLSDFDRYEDKNHNRTVGGEYRDIRRSSYKVKIARRLIQRINPEAEIIEVRDSWQMALSKLRSCDVLFGCVDSFAQRDQLERLSRRYLIPYIDLGMDVHSLPSEYVLHGQVVLSMPGSLCMRCLNLLRPELLEREAQEYGSAGDRPQVIWPNGVLASSAIGLLIEMVTPWHDGPRIGSTMLDYDGNAHKITVSPRVAALSGVLCPHFENISEIGDPFWESGELDRGFERGILSRIRSRFPRWIGF